MSTELLFNLAFPLAAPFWLLMIVAPRWRFTELVITTPWVAAVPLLAYLPLVLPHLGELWAVVSRPDLGALRDFLATPTGSASIWAHLVAFDLFIGRWMYFDSRERGIHPLLVAPVLSLTILLSAFGLLGYLLMRTVTSGTYRARSGHIHVAHRRGAPTSVRVTPGEVEAGGRKAQPRSRA